MYGHYPDTSSAASVGLSMMLPLVLQSYVRSPPPLANSIHIPPALSSRYALPCAPHTHPRRHAHMRVELLVGQSTAPHSILQAGCAGA